jgi:hypothetical protein
MNIFSFSLFTLLSFGSCASLIPAHAQDTTRLQKDTTFVANGNPIQAMTKRHATATVM